MAERLTDINFSPSGPNSTEGVVELWEFWATFGIDEAEMIGETAAVPAHTLMLTSGSHARVVGRRQSGGLQLRRRQGHGVQEAVQHADRGRQLRSRAHDGPAHVQREQPTLGLRRLLALTNWVAGRRRPLVAWRSCPRRRLAASRTQRRSRPHIRSRWATSAAGYCCCSETGVYRYVLCRS